MIKEIVKDFLALPIWLKIVILVFIFILVMAAMPFIIKIVTHWLFWLVVIAIVLLKFVILKRK